MLLFFFQLAAVILSLGLALGLSSGDNDVTSEGCRDFPDHSGATPPTQEWGGECPVPGEPKCPGGSVVFIIYII